MKLSVILALVATASAAITAGCASGEGELGEGEALKHCECDAKCTTCEGTAGEGEGEGEVTKVAATACFACAEGFELADANDTTKVGTCKAKASGAAAGKALLGEKCDQDGENDGCAEGFQCGLTPEVKAVEGDDTVVPADAVEVCVKPEDCKAPGQCGAIKLGASLAAALAIANYM